MLVAQITMFLDPGSAHTALHGFCLGLPICLLFADGIMRLQIMYSNGRKKPVPTERFVGTVVAVVLFLREQASANSVVFFFCLHFASIGRMMPVPNAANILNLRFAPRFYMSL